MHCFEKYKMFQYINIKEFNKIFYNGLYSEIWIYEEGIVSNRKSAYYGESCLIYLAQIARQVDEIGSCKNLKNYLHIILVFLIFFKL